MNKMTILQKRLAAKIFKCSPKKAWVDPEHRKEVREAITTGAVKGLIKQGIIKKNVTPAQSKVRSRETHKQKIKGRQRGTGSRKGKSSARTIPKAHWINHIRAQRKLLFAWKESGVLAQEHFKELYAKAKGGFFRSTRHIHIYAQERALLKKPTPETAIMEQTNKNTESKNKKITPTKIGGDKE